MMCQVIYDFFEGVYDCDTQPYISDNDLYFEDESIFEVPECQPEI